MKATGVVRKIDELGRVVLPKSIRDNLKIEEKDPLEIYVEDDLIILKKFETSCTFCGETKDIEFYRTKPICACCRADLKE